MNPQIKLVLVTAALMSTLMDVVLSGLFTFLNFGFTHAWLVHWLRAYFIAWPVAFFLVLMIGQPVRRLAAHLSGVKLVRL